MTKWKLVSPQTLIGQGCASRWGLGPVQTDVGRGSSKGSASGSTSTCTVGPPPGHHSGLDAALEEERDDLMGDRVEAELLDAARKAKRAAADAQRSSRDRRSKDFGDSLVKRAKERAEELHEEKEVRRRKKKRNGEGRP